MLQTVVPLALAALLLLSPTRGVAASRDWNALLFPAAPTPTHPDRNGAVTPGRGAGGASPLPADPVAAAATCAAVYGYLYAHHAVYGHPEESGMFEARRRTAWKAVHALVAPPEDVGEHIDAAEERLEFLPGGAWRHIRASFSAYDAACTALLAPRMTPAGRGGP